VRPGARAAARPAPRPVRGRAAPGAAWRRAAAAATAGALGAGPAACNGVLNIDEASVVPPGGAAGATDGGAGGGPGAGAAGAGGDAGGPPAARGQRLALDFQYTCAVLGGDGDVYCWGVNYAGQLGDGTTDGRPEPRPVRRTPGGGPLAGAGGVAVGQAHGCALARGGGVLCWGRNLEGQLGDGSLDDRPVPVPVLAAPGGAPLADVRALAAGSTHTCAVVGDGGEVRCWGDNLRGQLGDDAPDVRASPAPVQGQRGTPLRGAKAVALGAGHSCALLDGGAVCWGQNDDGQLGDGTIASRARPAPVLAAEGGPPLGGVTSLAAGRFHACAIVAEGAVRCWGKNDAGQLGDGTAEARTSPVAVVAAVGGEPLVDARALALGESHSCALVGDAGRVHCWGAGGLLGDGTTVDRSGAAPVASSSGGAPLTGVTSLGLGSGHSCALVGDRDVRCWGSNVAGQLGDGTTADRPTPTPILLP
jgi:alpha-tubulin suppressor-like RCC1 family protein